MNSFLHMWLKIWVINNFCTLFNVKFKWINHCFECISLIRSFQLLKFKPSSHHCSKKLGLTATFVDKSLNAFIKDWKFAYNSFAFNNINFISSCYLPMSSSQSAFIKFLIFINFHRYSYLICKQHFGI